LGEHIDVITTLGPDLGTIRVDPAQLEQVMLSLASNARDAMPNGGTLRVATAQVSDQDVQTFGLDTQHAWIVIRVTDTGVGMTAAVRERIFEPFFTTKERGKGTGLGLPLAYDIIDQSGGEIRVDSVPGNGTTFYLLLPRLGERPTDLVAVDDVPEMLTGQETVLLTEDEDSVRVVATAALERRGYRVLAAADGESAIAISRAFPGRIDLLISDVVMPGMNGQQLAEQLEMMLSEKRSTRLRASSDFLIQVVHISPSSPKKHGGKI
jgi:hypothetical protein